MMFLYKSIHDSLSVEWYLLPSFKALKLDLESTLWTVSVSGKRASNIQLGFECLNICFWAVPSMGFF